MSRCLAWGACAITTALAIACVVLAIIEPEVPPGTSGGGGGVALSALGAMMLTSLALVGAVVATRQPRNAVGWLLGLIPLSFGLLFFGDSLYWQLTLPSGAASRTAVYAAWLANWTWIPSIVAAFALLPLLFPTGRPLSPRWRPLVGIAIGTGAVIFVGTAFAPGPLDAYHEVVNPLGIDSPAIDVLGGVGFGCLAATALASVASLVLRYQRSHGVEHQQIRWVAAASVLLVCCFVGAGLGGDAAFALLLLGLLIVAIAVAFAMLRYRLYDIDVVINRALVYSALTATLAGCYLGAVLLLQLVLSGVTQGSGLAVASSTLAVAALFRPARARIQGAVDRRFYRRKYDAQRTLDRFSTRLRNQLELAALTGDLTDVVKETLQPAHVTLWLRERP
jgi:hypothetical protein